MYDVAGAAAATLTRDPKALVGDPGSGLDPAVGKATGGQGLLAADVEDLGDDATEKTG